MPLSCKLAGGSGGSGTGDGTSLNIFTQPNEPDIKDGIWVKKMNTHKKIVVDNRISSEGEWSDIITDCPISIGSNSQPVLYGNKIAVISDNHSGLYTFDGSVWTKIGEQPPIGDYCVPMVLNGTLYALGGTGDLYDSGIEYSKGFCKWNETGWTGTMSLPFEATPQYAWAVYNGYMYYLGSDSSAQKTYLWRSSGRSFTKIVTISDMVTNGSCGFVYNNKIQWVLSYYDTSYNMYYNKLCTCDGSSVTFNSGSIPTTSDDDWLVSAQVYDSVVHSLIKFNGSDNKHYKYNGTTWTYMFPMPSTMWLCPFNTRLYAFGGTQRMYYSKTHEKYDPYTLVLQISDSHDGPYQTAIVNASPVITGENNRFISNFDDAFFIGEDGIDTTDPIYYGNGTQWVKFKN